MGRRARRRRAEGAGPPDLPSAPEDVHRLAGDDVLVLRGVLSPATRREYSELGARVREDAWHRRVEFLFERLAVRWVIADLPMEGQKELLGRYRMASSEERRRVREALAEHLRERYPDVEV